MSRQRAIEMFTHHESKQGRIESILSAEPDRKTGEWIFCKDQMPEIGTWVLVVLKGGNDITIGQRFDENQWLTSEGRYGANDHQILAWMPLPSPPEI